VNFLSMTHLLIEPLPLGAVSQRLSHRLSFFNLAQKKKHPLKEAPFTPGPVAGADTEAPQYAPSPSR
jgi:hypothetical protein